MELGDGAEEAAEGGSADAKGKLFTWEAVMIGQGARIAPRAPAEGACAPPSPLPPATATPEPSAAPTPPLTGVQTLRAAASVIRSKNAGPFEITIDVIFPSPAVFHAVRAADVLTPALIASLYGVAEEDIVYCGFFVQALAFKVTIPRLRDGRPAPSGGYMENDVHGSQRYMPLMELEIDFGAGS
jgi:hypothetical protein